MPKYKARQCELPNLDKWCVYVDDLPGPIFGEKGQAIAEEERLQASWDAMLDLVKVKAGKWRELNTSNDACIGKVHYADELHALQCVSISLYVIHLQTALSQLLATEEIANITYRNGRGLVTVKLEQKRDVRGR